MVTKRKGRRRDQAPPAGPPPASTRRYVLDDDAILAFKNPREFDAEKIGRCIEEFTARNGGTFRTRDLLREARDPRHPCYRHLEWNDKIAAEAHRRDQLRAIISSIKVVRVESGDKPVQAFVSVHQPSGRGYYNVADIIRTEHLQLALLRSAERDLVSFEARYQSLADVCRLVSTARNRLIERMRIYDPDEAMQRDARL